MDFLYVEDTFLKIKRPLINFMFLLGGTELTFTELLPKKTRFKIKYINTYPYIEIDNLSKIYMLFLPICYQSQKV